VIRRLPLAVLLASIALLAGTALTAANVVGVSRAGQTSHVPTAAERAPLECAGVGATTVVSLEGTSADDLVLGTTGGDRLRGRAGDDCLVGGAGADTLTGNGGSDVCIGGAGADTYSSCEVQYP
jgi:Ca2+-binding RTX toxin-like protein